MEARRDSGLTAKQEKFAALLAKGYTQSGAYRAAYNATDMKDATIHQEACRLAHNPLVAARVRELLDAVRISDLDSAQRAFRDLLEDIEAARQAGNWTALAALTRDEYMPGSAVTTDDELLEFARETGVTIFHPSGTCKMGGDSDGVVDERLRVHGPLARPIPCSS